MDLLNHGRSVMYFFLVLIVAAVVHFCALGANPPSLNWDEASLGYNAYSILKTGKDEWGEILPITFRAFGEYKLPGYVYATVPSVALFGLNEFAVRFPSAFFGTLTAGLIFLIILRLTKNAVAALFGGLLFALTPWHVFLSRLAVEANVALFLVVLGVYLFFESIKTTRAYLLVFSVLAFVLSLFTYNSARIFVPLLTLLLFLLYRKEIFVKKSTAIIGVCLFLVGFAITVPLALVDSSARYKAVTLLDQGAINKINELRGNANLPAPYNRLVYNKATYFGVTATKNYLAYFSPRYLFLQGGSQYHFSLPNYGLLLVIELPLVFIGAMYLIRRERKVFIVLLAWLLLAPLPAAITRETPHVLRSIFMIGGLQILSAFGFLAILTGISKNHFRRFAWICILTIAALLQVVPYLDSYSKDYPRAYSCSWQYGYKQVAQFLQEHHGEYDQILITKRYGEPHIFMLFYQTINPSAYRNDPKLERYERDNWYWVDRFNGYRFVNDWELQEYLKWLTDINAGRILVVTSPGNYPKLVKPFQTISFLDNKPAFELLSIDSSRVKFSRDDLIPQEPQRGCFN